MPIKVAKVSCGFKHMAFMAIDSTMNTTVYVSGSNKRGQLGLASLGEQTN